MPRPACWRRAASATTARSRRTGSRYGAGGWTPRPPGALHPDVRRHLVVLDGDAATHVLVRRRHRAEHLVALAPALFRLEEADRQRDAVVGVHQQEESLRRHAFRWPGLRARLDLLAGAAHRLAVSAFPP